MNDDQIAYWDSLGGRRWTEHQRELDLSLRAFGSAVLDAAAATPGERVIDVGCGCGGTTLELADRVGPSGAVLGLDVSQQMLARARERAGERSNLRFERADAASVALPAEYALLFSRFGVMFFEDPRAAFANLRKALRPGGRLAFVCWRAFEENLWGSLTVEAVRSVVGNVDPPAPPGAPGPYAFAAPERLHSVLGGAGFHTIAIDRFDADVVLSTTGLEGAVEYGVSVGPSSRLLKDATPDQLQRVRDALRHALAPHEKADGVSLHGSSWIVTARG